MMQDLQSLARIDIGLASGYNARQLCESLVSHPQKDVVLPKLAQGLSQKLKKAFDMFAHVGQADNRSDPSALHHPSIAPHDQNHFFEEWCYLIDLTRESFDALFNEDKQAALRLLEEWKSVNYPVFVRLCLYAYSEHEDLDESCGLDLLLNDDLWLWHYSVQAEALKYLRIAASRFSPDDLAKLCSRIMIGPPRSMFRSDLSDEQFYRFRAHQTWVLLSRISLGDARLPTSAADRLSSLMAEFNWEVSDDPTKDELATWSESGWSSPQVASASEMAKMSDDEIDARVLSRSSDLFEQAREFGEFCKDNPLRSLELVGRFVGGDLPTEFVDAAFAGWRDYKEAGVAEGTVLRKCLRLLKGLDGEIISKSGNMISDFLMDRAAKLASDDIDGFLEAWHLVYKHSANAAPAMEGVGLTAAINHPYGKLASGLLNVLWAITKDSSDAIPDSLKPYFETLLNHEPKDNRFAQVFLCSRLIYLFQLDPEWTTRSLISQMDWSDPGWSVSLWKGYLWNPRISPDLASVLKESLALSVQYEGEIGDRSRALYQLLMLVWIRSPEIFQPKEVRSVLAHASTDGLVQFVRTLIDISRNAESKQSELWEGEIGPWVHKFWIDEASKHSESLSLAFAELCLETGDSFPNAVEQLKLYIRPVTAHLLFLHGFRKDEGGEFVGTTLAAQYPHAMLDLLDAVISSYAPSYTLFGLVEALDIIGDSNIDIASDSQYQRLKDLN